MSATLPPLPPIGGYITQKVLNTMPDSHCIPTNAAKSKFAAAWKWESKTFSGQGFSPTEKPSAPIDTERYRNSFMDNLCLDMLQEGFHLAFQELFNLVQEEKRRRADNESTSIGYQLGLEEAEDKLTFMKEQLLLAETAERQGRSDKVYSSYVKLAKYFEQVSDYWLSDHFYQLSSESSVKVRGDGRCKEAEAYWNLGIAAERRKEFNKALSFFEKFHSIARGKSWVTESGVKFHNAACDCLQRIYVTLSEMTPVECKEDVLDCLQKAYAVAKGGGDECQVGNVGYLLGNRFDYYGDQETAVTYYNEYLKICKEHEDDLGIGKACQALAIANQRQGNMTEAIENLKMFLRVSERAGDLAARQAACSDIGFAYNAMGKYEQSANYFRRAFDISKKRDNPPVTDEARCEYAISLSHGLLTGTVDAIVQNNRNKLDGLLWWKSERVQGFSKDKKTFDMYVTLEEKMEAINLKTEAEKSSRKNSKSSRNDSGDAKSVKFEEKDETKNGSSESEGANKVDESM